MSEDQTKPPVVLPNVGAVPPKIPISPQMIMHDLILCIKQVDALAIKLTAMETILFGSNPDLKKKYEDELQKLQDEYNEVLKKAQISKSILQN